MRKGFGKSGFAAKKFFGSTLPMILLAACFVTAGLNFAGVIDLKQAGQKIKSSFAPAKESSPYLIEAPKLPPLIDGTEGEQYWIKITVTMEMWGKEVPSASFLFTEFDPEYEPMPPGLKLSSDGVISGVPTNRGSYDFGVCIEDSEGDGKCYDAHININPKQEPAVALLTGNFTGSFEFTDNVGNPLFRDTGILNLQLKHNENDITGVYTFTQIKMEQLQDLGDVKFGTTAPDFSKTISGKVSGARIEFSDGSSESSIKFTGNFNQDTISLRFTSCYLNGCCYNEDTATEQNTGTKTKTAEGVPDVPAPAYVCESGIKGTAELKKIAVKELPKEELEEEEKTTIEHKSISIIKIPLSCIRYRDDSCALLSCVFEGCKCVDENPIVYEKYVIVGSEDDAKNLVKEYIESERLSYSVSSSMKLSDVFYNVYTDNNIIYTVTSNGIVMKTEC